MRLYVLLFAGFIAAFGAFRWRLPGYRHRFEEIGRQGVQEQPADASAADPSYPSYRRDVPIATSSSVRSWVIAIGLIVVMAAAWLLIAIFA
jgi:hypothetical protein